MKSSVFTLFFTFFTLFSLSITDDLAAQGCSGISFSFEQSNPCQFRARYSNSSECFIEIRYSLASGTFASWNVNSAAGFTVDVISPSELWIHHNQGFVPLGSQVPLLFTLPPGLVTTMNIAYLDNCAQLGCEIFGGIPIESCPDPLTASIIGVKYRECGTAAYSNQPLIPDWTIQLLDTMGNVLSEQVTNVDGAYAFFDLPAGPYIVREAQKPGWTSKFPQSGQYAVTLNASQQAVRNFGNCPDCSCDKIQMAVQQTSNNIDVCCYKLAFQNSGAFCFNSINIEVDPGTNINTYTTLLTGWTVVPISPQIIRLVPPATYLPIGNIAPLTFCVSGGSIHNIHVSTSYTNNMSSIICDARFYYTCAAPSDACVCPSGTAPGANLVTNGNFSTSGGFTSSYTPQSGLIVLQEGEYWLGNNSSLINGTFQPCLDHSGTGNMMVVNGSTTVPAPKVWCQNNIAVAPNMNYKFEAWVQSLTTTSPAQLQLFVNNVSVGASFSAPFSACKWDDYCVQWYSGTNTTVNLCLVDLNNSATGNDFALDDISFVKCAPPPPSCTCQQNPILEFNADISTSYPLSCGGQLNAFPCPSGPVTISGNFGCVDANGFPCVPASPINWILYGPNGSGIITQGAINGGAPWTLPFSYANVSSSGQYTLYMTTLCGGQMDSCKCIANWYQECQPCKCDSNSFDLSFRYGGAQNVPVSCGETLTVTPGSAFYSSFQCQGTNCNARVDWYLTGPNGYAQSMVGVIPGPGFIIPPVQPTNFPYPGTYCLLMRGHCGADSCDCKVYFCLPPTAPVVDDTLICHTLPTAYIPLFNCPVGCTIAQVQWFVKPCSVSTWPTTPYQVSSGGILANCSDLLLLPYKYPNETCVQIYAVIDLAPGCCVSQVTSNIATITFCNPVNCTISNNNPPFCDVASNLQPLTVSLSNTSCNPTVEWYNYNNILVSTALSYTPPNFGLPAGFTACYRDYVFTVKVKGICGITTCTTTIRLYNSGADNGDLIMNPFEPQPFCPGEDATLEYIDKCSGPPAKWTWSSSTVSGTTGFSPLVGAGMTNTVWNTNQLYQTTWYQVTSQNGVCPPKKEVFKIEVKGTLSLVNFTAMADPCSDQYVNLSIDCTPTQASPGCAYVVQWYWNGNLIGTSNSTSFPINFTFNNPGVNSLAGVYYAVVKDNCCPGSVKTWPEFIQATCVPVIGGPCFICGYGPVTLVGEMVLPPQDPCPDISGCTFQWYEVINGNLVPITGATGLSITINHGGTFIFESICNGCKRHDTHVVKQCGGTDCVTGDHEAPLPAGLEVQLFPNPTYDILTLKIAPSPLHHGRVEIVGLDGKVLLSESLTGDQSEHAVSLGHLPTGLYFVRLYEGDLLLWKGKIVKAE